MISFECFTSDTDSSSDYIMTFENMRSVNHERINVDVQTTSVLEKKSIYEIDIVGGGGESVSQSHPFWISNSW